MARMKKDGTPAKKPGRKPKPVSLADVKKDKETADRVMEKVSEKMPKPIAGGEWEKAPEITDEDVREVNEKIQQEKPVMPLSFTGYTVRCLEGAMGKFYYDSKYDRLDWTTPEGDEVSFSPEAWKKFATEELPLVMALLGVNP